MNRTVLLLALPLLAAGCGRTTRNVEAQLDADFATGQVVLSCKASSSGTCYAIFLGDDDMVTLDAAVGASASTGINEGARYCLDASAPDPGKCHPKPLAQGKQIVRASTVKG